MTENFVQSWDR